MYAGLRSITITKLFPDTLKYKHIRVHGHADGQQNPCYPGKCKGSLKHGQYRNNQDQIQAQGGIRKQTKNPVIQQHKNEHQNKPNNHRKKPLINIRPTQTGTHGSLFYNLYRCCQRAGPQQQRKVPGFRDTIQALNLESLAQLIPDYWCSNNFFNTLLDSNNSPLLVRHSLTIGINFGARPDFNVDNCHPLTDVVSCYPLVDPGSDCIKRDTDDGTPVLGIDTGRRIGDVLT